MFSSDLESVVYNVFTSIVENQYSQVISSVGVFHK